MNSAFVWGLLCNTGINTFVFLLKEEGYIESLFLIEFQLLLIGVFTFHCLEDLFIFLPHA